MENTIRKRILRSIPFCGIRGTVSKKLLCLFIHVLLGINYFAMINIHTFPLKTIDIFVFKNITYLFNEFKKSNM